MTTDQNTHVTLLEYLQAGNDIAGTPGFGGLCELAADLPRMAEEDRQRELARIAWDPVGSNDLPAGTPFGGWKDVEDYRQAQRWAAEMIESPEVLDAFMAAIPATYRVKIERHRWEDAQPDFRLEATVGTQDQRCDVCEVDVCGQFILRLFPTVNADLLEHDDILICVECVRDPMSSIDAMSRMRTRD